MSADLAACVCLVLVTGVIGRRMKMDAFVPAIPELVKSLGSSAADAHRAAVAITTTDLVSKEAALEVGHTSGSHLWIAPHWVTPLGHTSLGHTSG
jgi:N-acetylglutamate synthase/N-acetylornithine aminotransferase